jgi:uncharacterized surface protein with fasciclin (FAS1) repeats
MHFYTRFYTSVKSLNKLAGVAAALLVLPIAVACGGQTADTTDDTAADTTTEVPAVTEEVPTATESTPAAEGDTIVEVATTNGSFNTLVSAIQAADLVETLSGEGPYTVFAPTDEAFAALPAGTLDKLLLPENKEALTQVLTYHVVPGDIPASDIKTGAVATVEGGDVDISADAGEVTVNGAAVTQADVTASNGVIHVIDAVLLPPSLDLAAL